jgi:predicted TIM-barrel fold metal-dependent hydrolase
MICDFHTHLIPKSIGEHTLFFKDVWTDEYALLKFLDENDIRYAHLVYPSTDAHQKLSWKELARIYNEEIMKLARKHSDRLVCSAILPLEDPDIKSSAKKIQESGFKSISLASSENGEFLIEKIKRAFSCLDGLNISVFIHPQIINPIGFERVKDPLLMPVLEYSLDISMCIGLFMMEGVFTEFKNLKIAFSSLGGVVPFLKDRFDGVYNMLRSRNMVKDLGDVPSSILKLAYVDLSGIKSKKAIEVALELFGQDHIMFASDYPANRDVKSQIDALSGFDSATREKILNKNFLHFFNIKKAA